jgi:3-isopropylmalate/(R)-2-methylmalate dehydratase small subunit
VLVARANFGCGSSREHAPWALLDYGFRAILAPSFADIFYNNCCKNGVLPVTLPDAKIDEIFDRVETTEGYQLTVDLNTQTVADNAGLYYTFTIDPFRRECLLNGWDDIGLTLRIADRITDYEKSHHPAAPIYSPVDASANNAGR